MANILFVTSDLVALLYPALALARRLQAAGHQVAFASFPEARVTVESYGLEFHALERNRYEEFYRRDAQQGVMQRLLRVPQRRQQAIEAAAVDGFADAVRNLSPDLVLIDGEMHEHIIAASATGLPIALLTAFVSIWRRPGLPPPHHLVRPGVGWRGSGIGMAALWLNLGLRKRRVALAQKLRHLGCDRLSVLRALARRTGFDFRRQVDFGQWLIPFTYATIPALSVHALEFEFPHVPRDGVHYLGPLVLDPRIEHRLTDEARRRLEGLFERRRRAAGRRKLIYAGFGSFFSTDPGFLQRLLAAVAQRSEWDLVVSFGGQPMPESLRDPPENVHLFPWVSQMEVLRNTDVAVTHGGIATVDECVCAKVPMLVYCGFETDMGGTTARVVHHGLGIAGDRDRDSPARICARLDRLLSEPSFADSLARMHASYAAHSDDRVAERVIESLLSP